MHRSSVHARRIQELSGSGLAAALAAIVVLAIFGAGAHPVLAIGGMLVAAGAFAWILWQPQRALGEVERRSLPPRRG